MHEGETAAEFEARMRGQYTTFVGEVVGLTLRVLLRMAREEEGHEHEGQAKAPAVNSGASTGARGNGRNEELPFGY